MADKHSGINTIIAFIILWATTFGLVWAIPPLSDSTKWFIDEFVTIVIPMFAIIYFDYKGEIPIGKETRQKIWFGICCGLTLVIAFSTFIMTAATWEYVEIEGHQVITYLNMISLTPSIIGVGTIFYVFNLIKNRKNYWRTQEKPKKPADS